MERFRNPTTPDELSQRIELGDIITYLGSKPPNFGMIFNVAKDERYRILFQKLDQSKKE